MSHLSIRIKRHADGSAALTCTRPDGSVTWQRQQGKLGLVFPTHDLTHYAVETVMGYKNGFYGLVAAGWEMKDFAAPWPRGPIPREAREVELLIGLFDVERRTGGNWSAADLRAQGEIYAASNSSGRKAVAMPSLTDEDVSRIRAVLRDVLSRWAATPPGDALELAFPVAGK
ncbi:MAG: hypothetical protein H0X40_01110 [Chthoniobacterales bacterium]|nr:hypothetical protein [Chthoniobacterales bacterium]